MGKPEVLFLLGNWNFVVGTNVEDLRNKVALVENPRTAMGIRTKYIIPSLNFSYLFKVIGT